MIDWPALKAANAPLNAFVNWDEDAGAGDGPLADLTIGVKSNIAVAGLPWTAGMALHRERIAPRDATAVARLRAAGATILGTLNMHEAALGATTDNPWFGRTVNPHDHGRTPGGSSGGSGAAVAAGLCDAALGTDTLGSVRIPAAYNGAYGLKPTAGAVSEDGLTPLHTGFDVIGPLARSLTVLERVWEILRDDTPSPPEIETTRILTLVDLGGVTCEPAVADAYRRVMDQLSPTAVVPLPPLAQVRTAGFVEAARELGRHLGANRRSDLLSPELRWLLDYGDAATPDPALLADVRATLVAALGTDGVLVMPTAPQAPFPHGGRAPSNQADFTCLANIAGLPALAVPAGLDRDGMPVGAQLVGPAGSEATLFALARTIEGES